MMVWHALYARPYRWVLLEGAPQPQARGLHSFPFQLNLSCFVGHMTQLHHECVLKLLKLRSDVDG